MRAVAVMISSVRRGLETERDALPSLLEAIGHRALRFEDFTAQPVASRAACLAAVEAADVYLLLLGEYYGEVVFDSGVSPTEEEFNHAVQRGIPIVVLRKSGVDMEERQAAFATRVEEYTAGRFRQTFQTPVELQSQVARIVRELADAPSPLVWQQLDAPLMPEWILADERSLVGSNVATLELHLVPVSTRSRVNALAISELPARLARLGRDLGLFRQDEALTLDSNEERALASSRGEFGAVGSGVRVARDGAVAVWQVLARDMLGSILDPRDVAERLAQMLRVGARLLPTRDDGKAAIAVGLGPIQMVAEGTIADLGRRSGASMGMRDGNLRIDAEDSVNATAITTAADEIAAELAARILLRFRAR